MADAGDLDIGGLFTPDAILSAAERVASAARQLAKEIFDAQPDVPDDFFAAWSAFFAEFTSWKGAHSSWFSRVWNTTRDELLDYVQRYNSLRGQWLKLKDSTNAIGFDVTNDSIGGALDDASKHLGLALKNVGIGLAVLVGVPLVGYVVYKLAGRA